LLKKSLIKKYLNLNSKIFVAYSGGPDSTALIHLLASINTKQALNIKAIHINHNLSEYADAWEKHCLETCSKLNIDSIVQSVEIKPDGGGIESASRIARYKVFESLLNEGDQLVLGHHADDVAETLFMRLLRGTGAEGMEGPKLKRSIGKGFLIRPFLDISKREILNYLENNNIEYIQDDSNLTNSFDRNFLRNKIFPLLETRWKDFPRRVNNFSSILKRRNSNYSNLIYEKYGDLITDVIDLKKLKELSDPLIADILRFSINEYNIASPNNKIIEEIIKTFIYSNPGPRSVVKWSRSDKEEVGGQITYDKGHIKISKR
tara:strand:- start:2477 stop:3433 length:957 start_codon:yes stop_codon:yes gene_type:complete